MTTQERHIVKKKIRRSYRIIVLMLVLMVLYYVSTIAIFAPVESQPMAGALGVSGLLFLFLALGFYVRGVFLSTMISNDKNRLLLEKNRHYFKMFYDAVLTGDTEPARQKFNHIKYGHDDYRTFAHGILITIMRLSGDEKNVREARQRMNKVFKINYNQQ